MVVTVEGGGRQCKKPALLPNTNLLFKVHASVPKIKNVLCCTRKEQISVTPHPSVDEI